jgi:hypothetical protein
MYVLHARGSPAKDRSTTAFLAFHAEPESVA